MQSFLQT